MIATYTNELKVAYLQTFLGFNLIAFLIHKPDLGITDTPSAPELTRRRDLTMIQAAASEIPLGQGYSRSICTLVLTSQSDPTKLVYSTSATFSASGGSLSPATHIAYARGVDLTGASIANGNNRGSSIGTLIKVEPLQNAPFTLTNGVTFTHTTTFELKTQAV